MEDGLRIAGEVWAHLTGFYYNNLAVITILSAITLIMIIVIQWPDRATFSFLVRGIRVPKERIRQLRKEMSEIMSSADKERLQVVVDQQAEVDKLRFARDRAKTLRADNPKLVDDVGKTLAEIERNYKSQLSLLQSEAAKEALRQTAEIAISDVLREISETNKDLPRFNIETQS